MSDYFIEMINDIDFSYEFIYECANLVNTLYNHNYYNNLAIKLYCNFVLPIINITKDEHVKEYNKHVNDSKYINRNCSYLIFICYERYFELSKDKYYKIKKFIDDNIDTFESILAPIHNTIDSYKKCYNNYCYCSCSYYCLKNYCKYTVCNNCKKKDNFIFKSIVKSYFNLEYIKFFYLLQKVINLNTRNIRGNILKNTFIKLYYNIYVNCNEKVKSKTYDLYRKIMSINYKVQ